MIRYRPPQKSGSKYITAEGALLLKKELNQLWKIERPKVTQQVSEAAALGDRSENAEYIYGKGCEQVRFQIMSNDLFWFRDSIINRYNLSNLKSVAKDNRFNFY